MGASLITYHIITPARGVRKLVDIEVARITKALKELESGAEMDDVIHKLGVSEWDYDNDNPGIEVSELIECVERDLELVEGFNGELDRRDAVSFGTTINGMEVRITYAGGPSWGDSPDGEGYQTLGALYRLGIGQKLSDMVK